MLLFLIGAATVASVGAIVASSNSDSNKNNSFQGKPIKTVNNINYNNCFNNQTKHYNAQNELDKEELLKNIKKIFKEENPTLDNDILDQKIMDSLNTVLDERELLKSIKELGEKITKYE